jgi:hypothetical protein
MLNNIIIEISGAREIKLLNFSSKEFINLILDFFKVIRTCCFECDALF